MQDRYGLGRSVYLRRQQLRSAKSHTFARYEQKAQSKLEMAISARKRVSEKLETLMKKKKINTLICYYS